MSDLRITEAFLYMDYLVGAGQGWRVVSRNPTCPMSLRLEEQPFYLLSLGWDAFGVLPPAACSGTVLGHGGAVSGAEGVVELTGKGAAPAAQLRGEGRAGGAGEMGPRRWGVLCPRSGSLLPLCVPRKGLSFWGGRSFLLSL